MTHNNAIAWRLTVDINTTHNLFSCNNVTLPYEVTAFVCSCGSEKIIISNSDCELPEYECSECGNDTFYDANYYNSNYASYEFIEKAPFYEQLTECVDLEFEYDQAKNTLRSFFTLAIPTKIELSQEKLIYSSKKLYSLHIDKVGDITEELHVGFDLDVLMSKSQQYYLELISQSELINKHEFLSSLKRKLLKLLVKHPISASVALVKYECSSIDELAFFMRHTHLKEYSFLTWQERELNDLPKSKPLSIKDALSYILNHRTEKSLIKAVYTNYETQTRSKLKYRFLYIHCVCKYINDPNIASRMVDFKLLNEYEDQDEHFSFTGVEKLFEYLVQNYTPKQIEQLIEGFSKNNIYLFFDLLEMFVEFDDAMLKSIEKIKPRFNLFHNAIAHHHRILVHHKLLEISFEYSTDEQNACIKVEPYEIRLPHNGLELYEWSSALQNCLSGYAQWILHKETTVYGFFKENKLEIAVEVRNNSIIQASSKYNTKLSNEETYLINGWFREYLFKEKNKVE